MKRRKVLAGIGSLAAGGAAAIGTGAFTSVEATRTVNVTAVGDSTAYLDMEPSISSPNSTAYASDEDDSTVQVTFDEVNKDAESNFHNLFEVTNQGTQEVVVYVDPDDGVSPEGVTVPLPNESGSRDFPEPGGGSANVYIDPQATDMPNEPQPFSLTGTYGSAIPRRIAEYEGLGSIGDPQGSSGRGSNLIDRRIGVGESFKFGLNVQHESPGTFPSDISVALKAVDTEEIA